MLDVIKKSNFYLKFVSQNSNPGHIGDGIGTELGICRGRWRRWSQLGGLNRFVWLVVVGCGLVVGGNCEFEILIQKNYHFAVERYFLCQATQKKALNINFKSPIRWKHCITILGVVGWKWCSR